jgi:hypothetical protein
MRLKGRKGRPTQVKVLAPGIGWRNEFLHVTPGEINMPGIGGNKMSFEFRHR